MGVDVGRLESLFPVEWAARGIIDEPASTIQELAPTETGTGSWAAIHNGRAVYPAEWATTPIRDGDQIIFAPMPGDFVAIGTWLLKAVGYALVSYAVGYGINQLIGLPDTESFDSDGITNSFQNLQMTNQAGRPIQVLLGTHPIAGNVVEESLRGTNDGGPTSTLDMTVALCEGPLSEISAVSINGNQVQLDSAASDYGDLATVDTALGTNTQATLGQDGTSNTQNVNLDLEIARTDGTGGQTQTFTTTEDVDRFRLNILFPTGLHRPDGGTRTIYFRYRYRHTSDPPGSFTGEFLVTVTSNHVGAFIHSVDVTPVDAGNVPRRGTYEIELRQLNLNSNGSEGALSPTHGGSGLTSKWDSVVEIQNQVYTYPNTALVRLQIDANRSINGTSMPNVIATCTRKIDKWDGVDESNPNYVDAAPYTNPAWCCLELLRNQRWGLGAYLDESKIDLQTFKDWADWCDELVPDGKGGVERRAEFSGVFDGKTSAWDAALRICASARATLYCFGETIKVKFEKDRPVSQVFNMSNIKEGSWRQSYLSRIDRVNRCDVQFLDQDNAYQPTVVGVDDPDPEVASQPQRTLKVDLPGVTRRSQALREARFRLAVESLGETVSFDADIDAVAVEPGDLVRVSHDVPGWGESGRITAASSTTITLDRDVTLESGITYQVLVRLNDDTRVTRTVSSPGGSYSAGSALTVDTAWGTTPAAGDLYALGPGTTHSREVVITSIRTNGELGRTLEGVIYDPNVHNDEIINPTESFRSMLDPNQIPSAVSDLVAVELENDLDQVAIAWRYPADQSIGGAQIWEQDTGGNWVRRSFVPWPATQSIEQIPVPARRSTDTTTLTFSVVAVSPGGESLSPDNGTQVTITMSGSRIIPDEVTGITAIQDDDLLRLKWTAPTNAEISGYQVRRGREWVGSREIGFTRTNEIDTTEFTPTLTSGITENYWVRPISRSGTPGRIASLTESNTFSTFGSAVSTNDFSGSNWSGSTLVNLAVNSDRDLEIQTPGTKAEWISAAFAMSSLGKYRIGTVLHISMTDDTWTDASYAWKSPEGVGKTWAGYTDASLWDTVVDLDFRTRTTGSGTWSDWRPLTTRTTATQFLEVQLRITMTGLTTNQVLKVHEAFLVVETI